jgi:4-amino-4-deoxy-L-arabinose transferase-like glycosyltransferase
MHAEPTPRASVAPASLSLVTVLAVALILGGFATVAWVTRTPGVTHSNDDALYMLLGDQLTHFSYRELFKVGAPRHGQYPPLWPALLGLTQFVTGGSETARFLLVTALMTGALALFFDLARRLLPLRLAVLVLAAAACNPFTILSAGRVMSEAAFLFWTILCLWALQRARASGDDRRFLVLAALAALAAALTRTIGLTLLAGVVGAWLLQRRWRSAALLATLTGVLVGGWLAWTLFNHEGVVGRSYVADAAQVTQDKSVGSGTASPVVVMARKVALRVRLQLTDLIPSGLPFPTLEGTVVDNVAWLLVTIVLGAFGAAAYWRLLPAAILYVLAYCALLSVWPWAPRRFFVPLQPLILLGFVLGALEMRRLWKPMARLSEPPRGRTRRHRGLGWRAASRGPTPNRGSAAIARPCGRRTAATTPTSAPSLPRSPTHAIHCPRPRATWSSARPPSRITPGARCSTRRCRSASRTRTSAPTSGTSASSTSS